MDKITMESWLKVYHNDSVLIKTFGLLGLKEQIDLMPVCQRFQHIIRDVIWKKKYNDLHVEYMAGKLMIAWKELTVESPEIYNRHAIPEGDLYVFLEYLSQHLKSLTVTLYPRSNVKVFCDGVAFNFLGSFENLEVLKYYEVTLTDGTIKTISENCKRLKELHLMEIGIYLTGKYLERLSNLETFCIKDYFAIWSYEQFVNIFKLPLKHLQLCPRFIEKKDINFIYDTGSLAETLEVLKIKCVSSGNENDFDILLNSSKPFGRLQELEIMSSINVDTLYFDLVSEKCLNLQRFYIKCCNFEDDILKFPPNLTELYIQECDMLSPENAWHILTKLNLNTLEISRIDSRKKYKFNYGLDLCYSMRTLKISPQLSNDCDKEFWMEIFENSSSDSFRQVESLTCMDEHTTDSLMELITRKMPMIQQLYIQSSTLSANYIYHLKNLKLLSFERFNCIDLWHLFKILQTAHQLESLIITESQIKKVDPDDNERVPSIGSCSLRILHIDYDNFEICKPFWLDLLRLNVFKIELFIGCVDFSNKFDWKFLLAAFEDEDIAKNIDFLVMDGRFRNKTLKTRRWFVEMLYESPINGHVERVLVNDYLIDPSLKKSEFFDRLTLCLQDEDLVVPSCVLRFG